MKTECKCEIYEVNGTKIKESGIRSEYEDPIFMNMQFCVERKRYEELKDICTEYKVSTIHSLIQDLLNSEDPYKLVEQYM